MIKTPSPTSRRDAPSLPSRRPVISIARSDWPALSRRDLHDLVLLASVAIADRRGLDKAGWLGFVGGILDERAATAGCVDLVRRCLLVAEPRARVGYRVALTGQARMQRFLRSAVGSAGAAAHLSEECAVRRMLLDALAPEDGPDLARGMCRDLVAMRDGLLTCSHAEGCAVGGCPFATAVAIEEIDMALVWLADAMPAEAGGRAGLSR